MLNEKHTVTTIALLAQHPRDIDPQALRDNLFRSALAISEMGRYEAALADADVNMALAGLAEYESGADAVPPLFPAVRAAVEAQLTERMFRAGRERERNRSNVVDVIRFSQIVAEAPSARAERDRHDRFLQDPGRYLPDAIPCLKRVLEPSAIDGFVHLNGGLVPWIFQPCGVGPSAIEAAVAFLERHPNESLILVVGSCLRDGAILPAGIQFVEVR